MVRSGRRTFDTGQDFFEKMQHATGKTTPADVLTELLKGYRKSKHIGEPASENGVTTAKGPTGQVEDPALGLAPAGSPNLPAGPEAQASISPDDRTPKKIVVLRERVTQDDGTAGPHTRLQDEYEQLRNQLLKEKIETQRALRLKATNQAVAETTQCPKCGLILLKEQAWQHIRQHNETGEIPVREGRAYCFKHREMEPVNSVCFPLSREDFLRELHGGVYPSGLSESEQLAKGS